MKHDSGLCGFLKESDRIMNKQSSLCEDLKFLMWQNEKQPTEVKLPKHKLIMARLKQGFFEYTGYKNL